MANLIPAGYYRAVAVPVQTDDGESYVQFGETKNGDPQVAVTFAILDGSQQGRRSTWFGYFTEKSTKRTIESLRFCGFKGDDLAALVTQKLNQEVSITIEQETYEGKTRSKVAWVNAPGGGGVKLEKPMGNDAVRRFAAKMKIHTKQVPEVAGKAAAAPAPAAGPANDSAPEEREEAAGPSNDWMENRPPIADEDPF